VGDASRSGILLPGVNFEALLVRRHDGKEKGCSQRLRGETFGIRARESALLHESLAEASASVPPKFDNPPRAEGRMVGPGGRRLKKR
jgi:hypothetical protein